MTPAEFLALPAREKDALVEEHVFGREPVWTQYRKGDSRINEPICAHYTTELLDGWRVVEKLRSKGFFSSVTDLSLDSGSEDWAWHFRDIKTGMNENFTGRGRAPLAICLAGLKAVGFIE